MLERAMMPSEPLTQRRLVGAITGTVILLTVLSIALMRSPFPWAIVGHQSLVLRIFTWALIGQTGVALMCLAYMHVTRRINCPYCDEPLWQAAIVRGNPKPCRQCGTFTHTECWKANNGCPVCKERNKEQTALQGDIPRELWHEK